MPEWIVALGLVGVGLLMGEPDPVPRGKETRPAPLVRHARARGDHAALFIIVEHAVTLFAVVVAYVLSGPVEWLGAATPV